MTTKFTDDQLQFRLNWIDQWDDANMTDEDYSSELDRWIDHCDAQGWDAEAIDIHLGYC